MNRKVLVSITVISTICLNTSVALATTKTNTINENKTQIEQKRDNPKDISEKSIKMETKKESFNDKNEKMLKQIKDNKIDVSRSEIVGYAVKFIGTPYEFAGNGPSSFDCSGFVKYVYAQFDIKLPRITNEQEVVGTKVDKKNLKPGDLVFFGSPAYHVGIYVGNDCYIHAPKKGDYVKISSLKYRNDYSKAVRVKENIGTVDNNLKIEANKNLNSNVDKNNSKNIVNDKAVERK